jgi:hypothetical protein
LLLSKERFRTFVHSTPRNRTISATVRAFKLSKPPATAVAGVLDANLNLLIRLGIFRKNPTQEIVFLAQAGK